MSDNTNEFALQCIEFEGKRVELPDWWARYQEDDPVFRTLEPGVLTEDRRLADQAEAQRAIAETHQPGRKALAVSYCIEKAMPPARRQLWRRRAVVEGQILTILKNALQSLIAGKSPKVACKKCKSALARQYIKSVTCPMCDDEIVSRRRREKLAGLRQKLDEIRVALEELPTEPKRNGPVRWLVGGWARKEGT